MELDVRPESAGPKSRPEELAVLGGKPAFTEALHVGRPNIGNRERLMARFSDMLDRRWLSNNGPLVQELEARIAALTETRHCIAVCNATIGLELATRAAGVQGEVIVPAYTFVATAHALRWQEITPVFCDMDPATHNLDPRQVEALITPRTTAILGTHVWGRPCDIEALADIAARRGLHLMFDAAHAFACRHRGRPIGGFGLAEVFSFHATKFINAFEGGAITTNDDALAARIRLMTNFGFAGYDNVIAVGTNGKMCEASAAMALTSIESLEEFVAVNRRNYRAYRTALAGIPGLSVINYDSPDQGNYQYLIIELDPAVAALNRDELVRVLHAENVLARRYFWPGVHNMEPYRSSPPSGGWHLPECDRVAARVIVLPTGTAVDPGSIERIASVIRLAMGAPDAIRSRLCAP